MAHGKNKQKNQKVGLGQEPKETREQRRRRIAEEAKAREVGHIFYWSQLIVMSNFIKFSWCRPWNCICSSSFFASWLALNNIDTSNFQDCMKILPYVGGTIFFLIVAFGLYVHTLPPKISFVDEQTAAVPDRASGVTFEEAMLAEMGNGEEQDPDVVNLDGDSL